MSIRYGERVILRGKPSVYGEVEAVQGEQALVAWDRVDVHGRSYRGHPASGWFPLSRLTNKTVRPAESRSTGFCAKCRGPHVYKHGRP